jgi:hypothetical protein
MDIEIFGEDPVNFALLEHLNRFSFHISHGGIERLLVLVAPFGL